MRYTFGDYTLDMQQYALWHAGIPLKLQPKVFDLLAYLIQHRERVVTRQALFDTLWPAHYVSEDALERIIVLARRAVGDSGRAQRVIKTVHGRGYRCVAPVEEYSPAPPGDTLLTTPTRAHEATASPAMPQPVDAERKQVTVLSCALSSVVIQAEGVDPETLYAIRQRLFTLAQQAVQRYEGTIQHFVDNGFLAYFGASVTQEDHAQRAVLAALRIREQLQLNRVELAPLSGRAQAVCMAVHTGVVGIAGEPGIGKSRLLYEFRHQVRHTSCTYLAGRCVSYGQATPYLPLLDLLRQACSLTESDAADGMVTKVHLSLQAVGMEPEEWGPYILRLLGREDGTAHLETLSPQALRTRTFETLLQMQLHASRQRPLLLEVEDVHWIDPTSEEWLVALVERLTGVPLLLLLSYRAGYQPPWMGKSYATQLALQRLTADESRRIVRTMLQARSVSDDLVQTIEAKGEGNPFFLEELAQAVAEQGDAHPTLVLPETVQAVLATRLDRLPPEAKALLQVAAVVGREVSGALLQAVTALAEVPLRQRLARLQEAEFLYEARPVPELVYTFKHALTQEVAYQSLLRNTRQQYHRQIAEVLVARFAAMVETQPEVLAHHYTEAGLNEQAIPYWQQAGERAAARSAHREAVTHCTRGLEVLKLLPDTPTRAQYELKLQLTLGEMLLFTKGPGADEVGPVRLRAHELCEQVGDDWQRFPVLMGLFGFHGVRGELQAARVFAEQLLRLAQRQHIALHHLRAHFTMGWTSLFLGELVAAQTSLERAMTFWALQQHDTLPSHTEQDLVVTCLAHMAMTLGILGYSDQALARAYEALSRAQALSHPYSLAYALVHVTWLHQLRREVQMTQEQAEITLALCEEQAFAQWLAFGKVFRGWALFGQGQEEEGFALMHQGIVHSPDRLMRPYEYAFLAEAYTRRGQREEGLAILTEQLNAVEHSDGRFYTAELHRLKGELLLRQTVPNAQQAEHCFHQALDLARRTHAKWWELRAAMSLSRLWQHQGKRNAARQFMAEVYGWFTEGFDTADLQEARALLNELQCG